MEDGAREERVLSAVHGGGKSCEERESLWAFLACLYVAALERRRRGGVYAEGRQWWEEEFEQGAVGCRERQRGQRVSGG